MVSADSYPSRGSGLSRGNSEQPDSGNLDRFMKDNVNDVYANAGPTGDDAPPRQTVQPGDLHHDPSAPRPGITAEVHGAMHRPTDIRSFPGAAMGTEGFPHGWTQAANPNQAGA